MLIGKYTETAHQLHVHNEEPKQVLYRLKFCQGTLSRDSSILVYVPRTLGHYGVGLRGKIRLDCVVKRKETTRRNAKCRLDVRISANIANG